MQSRYTTDSHIIRKQQTPKSQVNAPPDAVVADSMVCQVTEERRDRMKGCEEMYCKPWQCSRNNQLALGKSWGYNTKAKDPLYPRVWKELGDKKKVCWHL